MPSNISDRVEDRVLKSLLSQIKGDADAYQIMKLEQLVLSSSFITNVKQLSLTNEMKNTIYIFRDFGGSEQRINSKLEIDSKDIISGNISKRLKDLKQTLLHQEYLLENGEPRYRNNVLARIQDLRESIETLERKWVLVVLELNSDIILNEYLHYLFTRTAGNLMAKSLMNPGSNTMIDGIIADKLHHMPVLVPSINAQKNTLKIREEIDKRTSELNKLKELLLQIDQHDVIQAELDKINSSQGINDIIKQDESEILEFKSSVWAQYNNKTGEIINEQKSKSLELEDSVIKTIAAFLNTQGGKLIIGVQDRPERKVVGIEVDFQYSGNSKDIESFQNSLTNVIKTATNDPVIVGTYVEISIESIEGKSICVIDVKQKAPKSWTYVNMKNWKNKGEKKECFFVRSGPSSNIIDSRKSADEWKSARIEMQQDEGN